MVVVERLGGEIVAHVSTPASKELLVVKLPRSSDVELQQNVSVAADTGKLHVFDATGKTLV